MDFSHPSPHESEDSESRKKPSFEPPLPEGILPLAGEYQEEEDLGSPPKEAGYHCYAWSTPKSVWKGVSTQIVLKGQAEIDFANLVRSFEDMYDSAAKRGASFFIEIICPSSSTPGQTNALTFQWNGAIEKCRDIRVAEASGTYPRKKLVALARMWGDKRTDAEFAARPDVQGWHFDGTGWTTDPSSFWRLSTAALDFLRGGHIDEEEIVFVSMQPGRENSRTVALPGELSEKVFISEHFSSFGGLAMCHAMEVWSYFFPDDIDTFGVKSGRVDPNYHV